MASAEEITIELIKKGERFLVARTGGVEARAILRGEATDKLAINAGWYCLAAARRREVYAAWRDKYSDALKKADLVMIAPGTRVMERNMLEKLGIPAGKVYDTMQLGALLNMFSELSRTRRGILVVSSKAELMKTRIAEFGKIFPTIEFDEGLEKNLVFVKSYDTYPGNEPHTSWLETFDSICRNIDAAEFEVALLGCGSYGLPLCDYIYSERKKSAVYVGGFIQLLFGILGKRWTSRGREQVFFNEHWINVPKEYVPVNSDKVEGGCYW